MADAKAPASITSAVFDAVDDWSQPVLTYYDHASGERTELSAATLGNWAAKSANFFVDELGVAPGDEILIDLPEHWQTVSILLGAWWSAAHVRTPETDPDPASMAAVVTTVDLMPLYGAVDELLIASLDPFAMGARDLPPGVTDFVTSVRVHGDQYRLAAPVRGAALDGATTAAVVTAARVRADDDGIVAGSRVLSTRGWRAGAEIVDNLLAPLVVGASLVAVAHPDPDRLAALAESERVTTTIR